MRLVVLTAHARAPPPFAFRLLSLISFLSPSLPPSPPLFSPSHHAPDRVPCPVDPTHTIQPAKLKKHVRACTKAVVARAAAERPFFVPGVNGGGGGGEGDDHPLPAPTPTGVPAPLPAPSASRRAAAAALGPDGLNDLIDRLLAAAEAVDAPWPLPFLGGGGGGGGGGEAGADAASPPPPPPARAARHALQNEAIVACAASHGVFGEGGDGAGLALVELGAGRGHLGAAAAAALPAAALALLDRRPYRAKADRHLRHRRLARVTADIADVAVGAWVGWAFNNGGGGGGGGQGATAATPFPMPDAPPPPPLPPPPPPPLPSITRWVGLGKHLCGGATDLALRAAARDAGSGGGSQPRARVVPCAGLAFATCCHHGATWPSFCGKADFLGAGFTRDNFEVVSQFAAWALCGHGRPKKEEGGGASGSEEVGEEEEEDATPAAAAAPWQTALPLPRRHAAGAATKRLLDACRLAWLRRRVGGTGRAAAVAYVAPAVCGENRLLLGLFPSPATAGLSGDA